MAKLPSETYSQDEVEQLLGATGRGISAKRNRALIMVAWRCGLRMDEALSLLPKDVDKGKGTARVMHGKGDESRTVGIPQDALDAIERWLVERRALRIGPTRPLFCTITKGNRGEKIEHAYVRAMLRRLRARAGLTRRVHFHGLRHTFAADLYRRTKDARLVQLALGHRSLSTTEKYLNHIEPVHVIEAMKAVE